MKLLNKQLNLLCQYAILMTLVNKNAALFREKPDKPTKPMTLIGRLKCISVHKGPFE